MTQSFDLMDLGWSGWFAGQVAEAEAGLVPLRVAEVHRTRMLAYGAAGAVDIVAIGQDFAVGDWVLVNGAMSVQRRLERASVLDRLAASRDATGVQRQLIAANVDTLFITTSCNADFNVARLERYLALAAGAGCVPVVIVTKADGVAEPEQYRAQVLALQRGLAVVALDARDPAVGVLLAAWCRAGQTVALVGSSGVGKSTLVNTLTGGEADTAAIREGDARGRHTTTYRALRPLLGGGWIIDTPGMRALQLNATDGIDTVFAEITDLIGQCKFRDCLHEGEPGCAVQGAIAAGAFTPERLERWRKLKREDRVATASKAKVQAKVAERARLAAKPPAAKRRKRYHEDG